MPLGKANWQTIREWGLTTMRTISRRSPLLSSSESDMGRGAPLLLLGTCNTRAARITARRFVQIPVDILSMLLFNAARMETHLGLARRLSKLLLLADHRTFSTVFVRARSLFLCLSASLPLCLSASWSLGLLVSLSLSPSL